MQRILLFTLFILLQIPFSANAADNAPYQITKTDRHLLDNVERKLNQITTMKSPFVQSNDKGQQVTGMFYLSRPGKMRIQYDPPVNDFIVSNGKYIVYWDDSLRQQSHTTLGSTLADIILRKDLKFGERLQVCDLRYGNNKNVKICVRDTENLDQGTFILHLSNANFEIKRWDIVDQLGNRVTVKLLKPQYDLQLKKDLFFYIEPDKKR